MIRNKYITYRDVVKNRYKIYENGDIYDTKLSKFLIPYTNEDGYLSIGLMSKRNGVKKSRPYTIHRLVAYHFLDNPMNYPVVNHKDGNKLNPNYTNLEWCTFGFNNIHAIKSGLRPIGENASISTLTNAQVHEICQMIQDGLKNIEISNKMKIPYNTIQNIKNRTSWIHISKDYVFETKKRIDENTVRKICEYLELGFKPKDISYMLNIPKPTILNIRNKQTWIDISFEYEFNYERHLTESLVHEICKELENNMSIKNISKKYNIPIHKIYKIRAKTTWTEISNQYNF